MPSRSAVAELPLAGSPAWNKSLRRRLLAWYRRHRRDLPWRDSADPYRVWVSEIMLQQTQVVTVIPYFTRFLQAFPTIATLAAAPEHDVLRHWEGLGYYRRARQLHRAAQVVVSEHGGEFPRQFDAIRSLPGVGRYTAGAIASIAFDQSAPILEANTVRLFSRLVGFDGDTASRTGQDLLWKFATQILPAGGSGALNQALMELGSLVCTPRAPDCDGCPVARECVANHMGQQDTIPCPRTRPTIEAVREASLVIWRGDKILLRQPLAGERWAGLWDFPRFAVSAKQGAKLHAELVGKLYDLAGVRIEPIGQIATLKHGVTRFRITLDCFSARFVSATRGRAGDAPLKWLRPAELEKYPLSVTGRKLSKIVCAGTRRPDID